MSRTMVYQLQSYQSIQPVEGMYYYVWSGRGNNANASLLVNVLRGERPHIIIDPGYFTNELMEPCFEDLSKAIGKDGFRVEDIGLIINTHNHPAHCESCDAIIEKSRTKGSKGKISGTLVAAFGKDGKYGWPLQAASTGRAAPQFVPFLILSEGKLDLGKGGKFGFNVIHTPGHSPDSISLYWIEKRVLFCGDTVLNGSLGRTDQPGGNPMILRQSVEKLKSLDVEILVPGHNTRNGHIIRGAGNITHNYEQVKLIL